MINPCRQVSLCFLSLIGRRSRDSLFLRLLLLFHYKETTTDSFEFISDSDHVGLKKKNNVCEGKHLSR